MALNEFGLVNRFFTHQAVKNPLTRLGVGDDCALLAVPDGFQLAVTADTLVEGVHFFPGADPESLGQKALAVNLSDLAAMGAKPHWAILALTVPKVDEVWLEAFSRGLLELAARFGVQLIGGDTTKGPLAITIQAMGVVPAGKAMLRSAAEAGDIVYVTGFLGDAGLGLQIERGYAAGDGEQALARFHRPTPRIEEGIAIANVAAACLDISDGLLADLGHILDASGVGARVDWDWLPLSPAVLRYIQETGDWRLPLRAGDDYELCFTVRPDHESELKNIVQSLNVPCTSIGVIEKGEGLRFIRSGKLTDIAAMGYEHFSLPEGA
ncbi:MAG: thiamine-phosphate kinase [Pseudomonadota bacterium]